MNGILFDGKKAISLTGNEGWTIHSGDEKSDASIDHLYSYVSYMYRCVTLRANSIASMPFTVYKADNPIYEFDGATSKDTEPNDLPWLDDWPVMAAKIEASATLSGRAYFEQRTNILGGIMSLDWMLAHTVHPQYNGVPGLVNKPYDPNLPYGSLVGFVRNDPRTMRLLELAVEDVAYFWMPDYAVEIGAAVNYPAKAVMQNAGVIHNMDVFLQGYFDRGLIKASFLKYKDRVSESEAARIKEWFRRVMLGLANAFSSQVVRGDFEVVTVGEGIKDLRDNTLTESEKEAIAVGMGVPISKISPPVTGLGDSTPADNIQFIEDTIIPEIGWIYRQANKQLLNPLGYNIVAQPQQLRIMQVDENKRAGAFALYVANGLSVPAAIGILGIDVPEDVEIEAPSIGLQRGQISEMELAASNREAGSDTEKIMLNGAQISSALQIVDKFGTGTIDRETALNMYETFLGIDKSVANLLIPQEKPEKPEETAPESLSNENPPDILENLERIEEEKRFKRWLANRDTYDIDKFQTDLLTDEWKIKTAVQHIHDSTVYKATNLDNDIDDYVEQLSTLILDAIDSDNPLHSLANIQGLVSAEIERQFRLGADLDDSELLSTAQQNELDKIKDLNVDLVRKLILDSEAELKGISFDSIKERSKSLASRLKSWGNALRESFNKGRIFGKEEMKLEWRLGQTEEHCKDCLAQHGKVRTNTEWQQLAGVGIYCQSRLLECKGYKCDCSMTVVN